MNLCDGKYISSQNLIMDMGIESKVENKIDLEAYKILKLKEVVEICEKQAIITALSKNKSLEKNSKGIRGFTHYYYK